MPGPKMEDEAIGTATVLVVHDHEKTVHSGPCGAGRVGVRSARWASANLG